jgi:hypothetical protein
LNTYLALSELGQNIFDSLLDGSRTVSSGDVSQGGEREIVADFASLFTDESLPHKAASGVVREGEVDGLIEELLELLLVALCGFTSATDNRDTGLIGNPLCLPFKDRLLDARRLAHVILFGLLLSLLLLFLGRPHLLRLVDVHDGGFKFLGYDKDHSDHLIGFGFTRGKVTLDVLGAHIEDDRFSLASNSAHNLGLTSAGRSIEQEGAHMFGDTVAHQFRAEREDDVLSDELANERHAGIAGGKVGIVEHGVNVVELSDEVS